MLELIQALESSGAGSCALLETHSNTTSKKVRNSSDDILNGGHENGNSKKGDVESKNDGYNQSKKASEQGSGVNSDDEAYKQALQDAMY